MDLQILSLTKMTTTETPNPKLEPDQSSTPEANQISSLKIQLVEMDALFGKRDRQVNDFRRILGIDPDQNHKEAIQKAETLIEMAWKYAELSK